MVKYQELKTRSAGKTIYLPNSREKLVQSWQSLLGHYQQKSQPIICVNFFTWTLSTNVSVYYIFFPGFLGIENALCII